MHYLYEGFAGPLQIRREMRDVSWLKDVSLRSHCTLKIVFFFLLSMIDSHQNQSETDMDEGVGLHWDVQPFAAGSVK